MVVLILYGVYLTHSRGAILAVAAVAIVASRRKIGTIPSVILSAVLLLAARAVNASGGRDISAQAGEDRTALWGDGLALLKENPLFGAGYNQMADIIGKTAHNSIIVCAAELGLFGLFFWSMFLFPTMRDAMAVAAPNGLTDPVPVTEGPYSYLEPKMETLDKAGISQMARLLVFSLTGFLVSGMFLSRAFVMTFFLLGGMAEVVFQMALDRGMIAPRLPLGRVAAYSGLLAIILVPGMWLLVRVLNTMH
jgi:O-antigen ligase